MPLPVGVSRFEGGPLVGQLEVATAAAGGEQAAGVESLAGERTAEVALPIRSGWCMPTINRPRR